MFFSFLAVSDVMRIESPVSVSGSDELVGASNKEAGFVVSGARNKSPFFLLSEIKNINDLYF